MATAADFDTAVQFVLNEEVAPQYRASPVTDDAAHATPGDPGGLTKFGISQHAYPSVDIGSLTVDDAKALYYSDYWLASGADQLSMPLAQVMLDTAVNMGVGEAKTLLQSSGGDVNQYLALRVQRYTEIAQSHPSEAGFLSDWIARVESLATSITSAAGSGVGLAVLILLGVVVVVVAKYGKSAGRKRTP